MLRDGELVATDDIKNVNKDLIIRWMVGRDLTNTYPPRTVTPGDVILEVRNLSRRGNCMTSTSICGAVRSWGLLAWLAQAVPN